MRPTWVPVWKLVVVSPSLRCSTLPHCYLSSWRRYCGIRRSILPTQPNQRHFQSNPGPRQSTRSSRLRGPRRGETLCGADGLYGWFTTAKMEAHCYCDQSQRWDKIGSLDFCHFHPYSLTYCTIKLLIFSAGKDFLFVFGGKNESEACLGDGHFLCLDQQQWTEVCLVSFDWCVIFINMFLITHTTLAFQMIFSLHFKLHWASYESNLYKQVHS